MSLRPIITLALCVVGTVAAAQDVQYRSRAGIEFRSLPDTGPVARATAALAPNPRNVDLIIALGVAQSGARQFKDAIATFTRGMSIAPSSSLLYRWRGHRYISIGDFDRAIADLTRGASLDSTIYGNWYHLGIARFAKGDFMGAAAAFRKAQPIAPDAGELAGSTDWLWMSLMRAGRAAEAKAMLARRPDSLATTAAYAQRLKLYRGELGPDAVITAADTAAVQLSTLAFGVGNWYLVNGNAPKAREYFQRAISAGGWPGFGFLLAEIELARLPVER